jgi:hypothetical protein
MTVLNFHGLSRNIPEPTKREIRQNSGFGCVVCGCFIVDYEHFNPEFSQAKLHDSNKIALLCPMCHAKVTRKLLSKSVIQTAMENPKCKQQGFTFAELDSSQTHPYIILGGNTLRNCFIPVMVQNVPLIQIETPESVGGPYRLSASFFNQNGEISLQIIRNEWRAFSSNWDVELIGGRITIRSAPRAISLQIAFIPNEGIVVEKLDMRVFNHHFVGNKDRLEVTMPSGGRIEMTGNLGDNCRVGFGFS